MIMSFKCHLRTAPKENKNIWGVVAVALSWTFILGKGSKNKNGIFPLDHVAINTNLEIVVGEELILKKKLTTTSSCVMKL